MTHDVAVELVPTTRSRRRSSRSKGAAGQTFRLSIEQGFLEQLTEDELRAVVAHELGHVWIYTHHPYLQTEQLANQIAMRVVLARQPRQGLQQGVGGRRERRLAAALPGRATAAVTADLGVAPSPRTSRAIRTWPGSSTTCLIFSRLNV